MTAFRIDPTAGPGTHVFIVGVGAYPHLKDGTGRPTAQHRNLAQLTSPPLSALAMLEWVDKTLNNPQAPLKSIEVLVSQPQPATYTDSQGHTEEIAAATWLNFETSVQAWFDRADSDPDNVAIFYFCGHGIGDGINTYLLMGDTGQSPDFLRSALHLNAFRIAMGVCKAQKQVYFIDACRTVDLATVLSRQAPCQSGLPQGNVMAVFSGANPVLHSARQGEAAFGDPGQVSYFTEALIEGLTRCAVFRPNGKHWAVSPQELQKAIAALMDDFSGKPQCPADGIVGTGFQLHVLPGAPEVVVHVSLDTEKASASAEISYVTKTRNDLRRDKSHPWRTFIPFGQCVVHAQFAQPSAYSATSLDTSVYPPFQNILLEVQ
jgi:hypothetical protein